ncbi:MAG: 50S ribosomal protein L9 [Lachnospiraceae bacterium]|nr:50S ribosomal protein L9 [Lachnospiraceae bacterium]
MEVILLEDVKSLGKKGDRVKVSDGYARNSLIPKKLATEVNAKSLNDLKTQQLHEAKEARERLEAAQALKEKIEAGAVNVSVKTGEGGKLFGSISTKEIATAFKQQFGFEIDKKKMQLDEPIRSLGTVIIPVKLHKDVTAKLTVKVSES